VANLEAEDATPSLRRRVGARIATGGGSGGTTAARERACRPIGRRPADGRRSGHRETGCRFSPSGFRPCPSQSSGRCSTACSCRSPSSRRRARSTLRSRSSRSLPGEVLPGGGQGCPVVAAHLPGPGREACEPVPWSLPARPAGQWRGKAWLWAFVDQQATVYHVGGTQPPPGCCDGPMSHQCGPSGRRGEGAVACKQATAPSGVGRASVGHEFVVVYSDDSPANLRDQLFTPARDGVGVCLKVLFGVVERDRYHPPRLAVTSQ